MIGLLAIITLALIFWLLQQLGKTRKAEEGFSSQIERGGYDPYQHLEKKYYDAIEMVKTARVSRGNSQINSLEPASATSKHTGNVALSKASVELHQPAEQKCKWKKSEILARVAELQPGHLGDKPLIVHGRYYHDWRYRSKPIDIEFAMDPKRYCKLNPTAYPCYVKKIQDMWSSKKCAGQ